VDVLQRQMDYYSKIEAQIDNYGDINKKLEEQIKNYENMTNDIQDNSNDNENEWNNTRNLMKDNKSNDVLHQSKGNNIQNNISIQNTNVESIQTKPVENTSSNPPSILQKLRERSNRPQRIPPKQSDIQVSPRKLETKIENADVNVKNNNQLLNSKINIMKRQKSFKEDNQQNNEINNVDTKISNENDKTKNNSNTIPSGINNQNQVPLNPTISTNNNVKDISRSNSGTHLSAMEKHKLKMKERRSVDKQKKLEIGTVNDESKDNKLNEDINKILGYDEYFENQTANTVSENSQPNPDHNQNNNCNLHPIDAMID